MQTATLVVGAIVLVLLALRLVEAVFARHSAETLEFRGPVRALDVALATGEVTVRGSGRSDARVRRTIRHGLRRTRITELVDDGVLRLRAPRGVVQYEIDVPAGASVHVEGRSASTTVIGVRGSVDLRAGRGSLEGRALAARDVHAVTSAGSIRLSFDQAPDVVDVATKNGSVELVMPEGETEVHTSAPGPVQIRSR